ncbi:MFS transporter [Sandarakinorhabdus cyanobacteriorum]|uniref:MFS transporter n=1 Tax=Sandarakinorhabdus cyanobacteriorum TaxID=1981098 RepID=A0A255Z1U6_9SPHN|nr:OFA family MFS transporter [Sandarakinorhabdus cyanobacteriorum]OYQ35446.1 MFS transporter [Sandarakinorhabdus cyanobacteriorum]
MGEFLSIARITAPADHDRWLVPPCALAIHLCIGMAYGFSVFWLPLSHALGQAECPSLGTALTSGSCDWRVSDLVWVYSLFFVVLGLAAALFGAWVERVGPRRAGLVAAGCWAGGMAIGAIGVALHQLWLFWLGTGVIGGIGLGIGYITPVSTLLKWFPDRRGLATGMAIMGFGGGAMVGSPAADRMMAALGSPAQTMLLMAAVYAVVMAAGALGFRLPAPGWHPPGARQVVAGGRFVPLGMAWRTRQFWLVWCVLLMNVSASIGIIGLASPMVQEMFAGQLIGLPDLRFEALDDAQKTAIATIGAAFVGLISLFNIAGRFFWSSLSDRIGRKPLYLLMLALAGLLYGALLPAGPALPLFLAAFALIASMYGGGFAAVPAWLADLFGTAQVGAIHGRLLTAWSTAGVLGPLLVAYVRDASLADGVARADVYGPIFLALAGLLAIGWVAALLVRPVPDALWRDAPTSPGNAAGPASAARVHWPLRLLAWAAVLLPLGWGAAITLGKAAALLG